MFEEKAFNVDNAIEINNKAFMTNQQKCQLEKLKGRFNILTSRKMPMQFQINRLSQEPIAFHLYKNRNFFEKLDKHVKFQIS